MRTRRFLISLFVVGSLAQSASAVLDRYAVRDFSFGDFASAMPPTFIAGPEPGDGDTLQSIAVVDRAGPTLRKLLFIGSGGGLTTFVGTFNGFIWFSQRENNGPKGVFTATSGSLPGNVGTVTWGALTSWTATGALFCNSNPALICGLAVGVQLTSVDPPLRSSFYTTDPWTFHGTGFRSPLFVFFTSTLPGNSTVSIKGALSPNATVPALPLLGVGALAASLFVMGTAALRRRR